MNSPLLNPLVNQYKFEKICELSAHHRLIGHEVLSKQQHANWMRFDRQTLELIGQIDSNLSGNVSINLSASSIINMPDAVVQRAAEMRPGLVIEWVESFCSSSDLKLVSESLKRWKRDYGIKISIDDIGKGQDGVERMLSVQPDFAKIEGTILHSARESLKHRNAMKFLCLWCQGENVPTIIEWIETKDDLDIAIECGGVFGQGYYFERMLKSV